MKFLLAPVYVVAGAALVLPLFGEVTCNGGCNCQRGQDYSLVTGQSMIILR